MLAADLSRRKPSSIELFCNSASVGSNLLRSCGPRCSTRTEQGDTGTPDRCGTLVPQHSRATGSGSQFAAHPLACLVERLRSRFSPSASANSETLAVANWWANTTCCTLVQSSPQQPHPAAPRSQLSVESWRVTKDKKIRSRTILDLISYVRMLLLLRVP